MFAFHVSVFRNFSVFHMHSNSCAIMLHMYLQLFICLPTLYVFHYHSCVFHMRAYTLHAYFWASYAYFLCIVYGTGSVFYTRVLLCSDGLQKHAMRVKKKHSMKNTADVVYFYTRARAEVGPRSRARPQATFSVCLRTSYVSKSDAVLHITVTL